MGLGKRTYLVELKTNLFTVLSESELQLKLKSIAKSAKPKHFRVYIDETESWVESGQMRLMPSEKREWYYLSENKSVGIFNELELIRMVQNKKILPTQLVWKPGMQAWTEFCRTAEFNPKSLRHIVNEFPPLLESIFSKRISRRIPFAADFILSGQEKVWRAQSYEIGAGGVGLQVRGTGLTIGQTIALHVVSQNALQNFRATAEVVSHLKDAKGQKPDRFGVKFQEIKNQDQLMIKKLLLEAPTKD